MINVKYRILSKDYNEGLSGYKFPVKQEGSCMRSFQYSWLTNYEWLTYSKSSDGALCKYCLLFGKGTSYNTDVGNLVSRPLKNGKKL